MLKKHILMEKSAGPTACKEKFVTWCAFREKCVLSPITPITKYFLAYFVTFWLLGTVFFIINNSKIVTEYPHSWQNALRAYMHIYPQPLARQKKTWQQAKNSQSWVIILFSISSYNSIVTKSLKSRHKASILTKYAKITGTPCCL